MKSLTISTILAAAVFTLAGCGDFTDPVANLRGQQPQNQQPQSAQNPQQSQSEHAVKTLFFPANNGTTGVELYKYDIQSNTVLPVDINPGPGGSRPMFVTQVGTDLWFAATDGVNGRELMKYNGLTGEVSIKNLNPAAPSNPRFITKLQDRLYFSADLGAGEGRELCYYDLITGQHGMVRNHVLQTINPGIAGSDPRDLKVKNGVLYFSAATAANGRELWKYDPIMDKDSGPVRITDVVPGPGSSNPRFMSEFNGDVYFSARTPASGRELYKYDSVSNVTTMIRDINPGAASSNPMFAIEAGGKLFFAADNGSPGIGGNVELMKYDMEKDMLTTACEVSLLFGSRPSFLTSVGDEVIFSGFRAATAQNGLISYTGVELWKYNIVEDKLDLVADISKGLFENSAPFWVTQVNDKIFFGAQDNFNGRELWTTDLIHPAEPTGNFNPGPGNFLPAPGYNFPYENIVKTTW